MVRGIAFAFLQQPSVSKPEIVYEAVIVTVLLWHSRIWVPVAVMMVKRNFALWGFSISSDEPLVAFPDNVCLAASGS
jgi:hypothetical protein